MGDPRKTKKHYETPKKPYDKERLEEEREMVKNYGLKSKRELWRAETILRKKRENARKLLALPLEERLKRQEELLGSLAKLGLVSENATLDDVLTLSLDSLLERRLQTMVLRQGLANTITQARQFVVHGHIAVNENKVNAPSYLVPVGEEKKIAYYGKKMELKPKEVEPKKEVKKGFEKALPEKTAEKKAVAEEKPEETKAEEKKPQKEEQKEEKPEKKKEKAAKEEKKEEKKEEAPAGKKEEKKGKKKEASEKKEEVKADADK